MSYTTQSQIETRISSSELIRLTDEFDTGMADAAKVDAAIAAADGEIDSYLASRYPVPLATVPGVIGSLACDIAIYTLYALNDTGGIPESRQKRYDQALKELAAIENGDRSIGLAGGDSTSADSVLIESNGRAFSRDTLRGW